MTNDNTIKAHLIPATAEVLCDWCWCEHDDHFASQDVMVSGGKCSVCEQPFRVLWMAYGRREEEYGESCTKYVVFKRSDIEHALAHDGQRGDEDLTDEDLAEAAIMGSGFYRYHGGPGRAFGHEPTAHVSRYRVLVKQMCGLDI